MGKKNEYDKSFSRRSGNQKFNLYINFGRQKHTNLLRKIILGGTKNMVKKLMKDTFTDKYFNQYFDEFVSDILVNLRKNNSEYNEILLQKEELIKTNLLVKKVVEDDEILMLNESEINDLIGYLSLTRKANIIEQKAIFFAGIKEAYAILKIAKMVE